MSALARFVDGLNPVLVKEVRASLRGRVFRVLFSIVALGSVAIASILLADLASRSDDAYLGRQFFGAMYLCLCVAVLGFVPILAFLSMGSEWDEHTYELLEISNLKPRQIVLGKLWTAAIETMLYTSVFAPLLVFAFLLRGVDIVNALVVLSWAVLGSLSASALALAMSSLSRIRALRVVLLAIVAGGCVGLVALMWNLGEEVAFSSWRSGRLNPDLLTGTYATIVGFGLVGVVVAVERVTHAEENHSTAPRGFVTVALMVAQAWILYLASTGKMTREDLAVAVITQISGLALFHVCFCTERETLPRRVRSDVSANRWLALLSTPFLPGGGRALLHFLGSCALVFAGQWSARSLIPLSSSGWFRAFGEEPIRQVTFAGYLWILLAGISWIAVRWTNPRDGGSAAANWTLRRWVTRAAIPIAFVATLIGPPMIAFLAGHSFQTSDRLGMVNPIWTMDEGGMSTRAHGRSAAVFVVVVLVLALNGGRLVRGVREVWSASAERRAREGARP